MKHTSIKIIFKTFKKNLKTPYISYLGVSSHSHNKEQRNVISELWVNPQLSLIKLIENILLFAAVIIH